MLHGELLDDSPTVGASVYATQLRTLADVMTQERPEQEQVYLLHDNALRHVVKVNRERIQEQGWEVLPHPPYSPDFAPSDCDLFKR